MRHCNVHVSSTIGATIGGTIGRLYGQFILNMYIPVCYTNGRSIKNKISVVVNCLVGKGFCLPARGIPHFPSTTNQLQQRPKTSHVTEAGHIGAPKADPGKTPFPPPPLLFWRGTGRNRQIMLCVCVRSLCILVLNSHDCPPPYPNPVCTPDCWYGSTIIPMKYPS